MRWRLIRVGAAGGLVALLAACSPVDIVTLRSKTGTTTTITVRAKSGPSDNRGSSFRAAVVCDGEPFWRRGPAVNVDTATPDANGNFESRVQCYDRVPVGITVERW